MFPEALRLNWLKLSLKWPLHIKSKFKVIPGTPPGSIFSVVK